MASISNRKPTNRRRAARIYEHVDLFYHKIASPVDYSNPSQHNNDDLTSFEQDKEGHLPKSSSQENETLNVNISATGISYTCQEQLEPGDHLLLKIVLLSSMTVITVSCEVVSCKPSNPFENKRYPFLIGGRFVNITAEDTKLLEQHIRRKKRERYPFQILLASLMVATIVFPDSVLEVIIGAIEFAIEHIVEIVFILFEIVSMSLDHVIEAIFHTKIHDTQMISFYLMCIAGIAAALLIPEKTLVYCKNLIYKWQVFLYRKKASVKYYWHEKSWVYKSGLIGSFLTVCLTYVFFFI